MHRRHVVWFALASLGSLGPLALLPGCGDDTVAAGAPTDGGTGDATSSGADASSPDGDLTSDGSASGDDGATADGSKGDGGVGPTCWPFDRPSTAALRASPRKVFSHYFSPYPISLDNDPPVNDYYARNYLKPAGESGAHAFCGGLLRERPLPQPPYPQGVDYEEKNMELEVKRALAIGLDGFTYDVLSVTPGNAHRTRLEKLLAAAHLVDPAFVIQLVPDMTSSAFGGDSGGTDADALAGLKTLMTAFGASPSVMRLADGRVVISPFGAERRNAAFWIDAMKQLATAGHPVALVPMPVGSWSSNASKFSGVTLYGASSWGTRTVSGAASLKTAAAAPRSQGLVWMAPVAPQDSRPKNLNFTEGDNSRAYRAQWESVISGGADWVQLITWNDYSEDSEIAPSSQTNTAFYDLSAYYTTWFKQGAQPPIVRDAIYYFHRAHSMDIAVAPPDLTKQQSAMAAVNGPSVSTNEIELVGLLTSPGTLQITVAGKSLQKDVGAGIQSFTVPLAEGVPTFRLLRGGAKVIELGSATTINNQIVYQDPLYHAGASPTCAP